MSIADVLSECLEAIGEYQSDESYHHEKDAIDKVKTLMDALRFYFDSGQPDPSQFPAIEQARANLLHAITAQDVAVVSSAVKSLLAAIAAVKQ